jgi:hypothetical protein
MTSFTFDNTGFLDSMGSDPLSKKTIKIHNGNIEIPINELAGPTVQQAVADDGVTLRARAVWYGKLESNFYHQEALEDKHLFKYNGSVYVSDDAVYGARHPILHPTVAAIDATAGGIDDAFLRALQNIDTLVGGGMRNESTIAMRSVAMHYSRLSYNPVRTLVRAAVLLANMYIGNIGEDLVDYRPVGVLYAPTAINTAMAFAGFLESQQGLMRDVLFVHCEGSGEAYMADVMHALCSTQFPMEKFGTVAEIWPEMNRPVVAYSGGGVPRLPPFKISVSTLLATMSRFCSIFDCHDLWSEALGCVQQLIARPKDCGIMGGSRNVVWALPRSDMRVGAIGPLLAGVSAEGRRTLAFPVPGRHDFLYASVVRGVYFTAAYFETIQRHADANPVVMACKKPELLTYGTLTNGVTAQRMMKGAVRDVARNMGWDCINDMGTYFKVSAHTGWQTALFRPHLVPWWTTIGAHVMIGENPELNAWFKPAQVLGFPSPGIWQPFHTVGLTTAAEIASAVRWVSAKVKYTRINIPYGITNYDMPVGTHTRFLPIIKPQIDLGKGVVVVGSITFPGWSGEGCSFLRQLARSQCALHPHLAEGAGYHATGYATPTPPASPSWDASSDVGAEIPATTGTLADDEDAEAAILATATRAREQHLAEQTPATPAEEQDALDGTTIENLLNGAGFRIPPGSYHAALIRPGSKDAELARRGAMTAVHGQMRTLWEGKDEKTAIHNLKTYINFSNRVLPHADGESQTTSGAVSRRVREAIDQIAAIKHQVAAAPAVPPAHPSSLQDALAEGVAATGVSASAVAAAVDDPDAPSLPLADFGAPTLQVASGTASQTAGSVGSHIPAVQSIGFATQATS